MAGAGGGVGGVGRTASKKAEVRALLDGLLGVCRGSGDTTPCGMTRNNSVCVKSLRSSYTGLHPFILHGVVSPKGRDCYHVVFF